MEKIKQFIKFGIVGCSNTVLAYAIYVLVLWSLKSFSLSWDYVVGNVVSFLISVLWSFFWNEKYVFDLKDRSVKTRAKVLFKTYISYGFSGLILSNVLSWIWISSVGLDKMMVPIINLFVTVPVNFLMNKLWAFK